MRLTLSASITQTSSRGRLRWLSIQKTIIMVAQGQQATTNIHRISKGCEKQCFSLWWVISSKGVLCYYLYEHTMDVDFFQTVMTKHYKPARQAADRRRRGSTESVFYHDHVTNSKNLYEEKFMDEVCGKDRWMRFSPAVCREFRGKVSHIAATEEHVAYTRNVKDPKLVCDCKCDEDEVMVPSVSPELNLAESAQGELRRRLTTYLKDSGKQWRGSTKTRLDILRFVIESLHKEKKYWKALYEGLRSRWTWVVDNHGALLPK